MEIRSEFSSLITFAAGYIFKKAKELSSFDVTFALERLQTNTYS